MRCFWILTLCFTAALHQGRSYANPACPQFFPGSQLPALINPKLVKRTTLLCNDAYAVLASGITHGALWSAEHLTAASIGQARQTGREGEFYAENRLPQADQAQLADYRQSGYDRGRMAPSGDMPNEQAQQQSFSLANMVPQAPDLNRGIWKRIESALRDRAIANGELYLVSGPAFRGNQIKAIGANGVLVPTSIWKAIYDPRMHGTAVYVCKNTTQATCDILPVATLIRVVGIDPFPALPASLKQVAMTLLPLEQSRYGGAQPAQRREKAGGGLDWLLALIGRIVAALLHMILGSR